MIIISFPKIEHMRIFYACLAASLTHFWVHVTNKTRENACTHTGMEEADVIHTFTLTSQMKNTDPRDHLHSITQTQKKSPFYKADYLEFQFRNSTSFYICYFISILSVILIFWKVVDFNCISLQPRNILPT